MEPDKHQISIYFGAPSYQDEPEGRARKAELEREFGLPGEWSGIGTGAEGPGLVFLIDFTDLVWKYGLPAWGLLVAGKDAMENIGFYVEGAKRLARYVTGHNAYMEREDAYILAVDAVLKHIGRTPKSLILEGYMVGDWTHSTDEELTELTEIGETPTNPAAWAPHHFQFKVDGKQRLKAIVDVDGTKVIELPPARVRRK